jgi:cytochrome c553
VVNRYLQCWDVPNVFSLGASAFPQEPVPKGAGPVGADMISGRLLYVAAAGRVDVSVAWNASAQMRSGAREPDAKHGAVIAAQGTPNGAPACAQCHAFNGVSDGSGAFPRIAGQPAYYLAKQLRDFTSGVRVNANMTPVAGALSADDIADAAAYYAGIDAPFLPLRRPDSALVKQGEELAKVGSATSRIQALR